MNEGRTAATEPVRGDSDVTRPPLVRITRISLQDAPLPSAESTDAATSHR
ncbi:hypothetical protein GFS60_08227 (plasmid) [Rhodococcus sp. WAY2]|nr:hypothetical protein GFS60_08227 [Rhodococcus sp. WAY2]